MKRNIPLILLVSLLGFLVGGATVFWGLRANPETARTVLGLKTERPRSLGLHDFFGGDTFADLQRMQEEMEKRMGSAGEGIAVSGEEAEIVRKDDDKSISFEVRGVEGSSLSTQIESGHLVVSGEMKKETGKGTPFRSVVVTAFHRVLPLPPDADASKMEMLSEKDKVILRFPRKKQG